MTKFEEDKESIKRAISSKISVLVPDVRNLMGGKRRKRSKISMKKSSKTRKLKRKRKSKKSKNINEKETFYSKKKKVIVL